MLVDLLVRIGAGANQVYDIVIVSIGLIVFTHIGNRVDRALNAFKEVHYYNINYGEISQMD